MGTTATPASGGKAPEARADLALVAGDLRARDVERWIACLWAPPEARPACAAALALDLEMARIVASLREPLLAEIRLAWWRERLAALAAGGAPPAQPLLRLLAGARPRLDPAALLPLEEAFCPLAGGRAFDAAAHARLRGATLFAALHTACEGSRAPGRDAACAAGEAWAWAELARGGAAPSLPPPGTFSIPMARLPRPLRALAALADRDLARARAGRILRARGTAGRQLAMARAALFPPRAGA